MVNVSSRRKNIRVSIIDTLEIIASKQIQLDYQRRVPMIDVSTEIFNKWEDWYQPEHWDYADCFSASELEAINKFHDVWRLVANGAPKDLPSIEKFQQTEHWMKLASAAQEALAVLKPSL